MNGNSARIVANVSDTKVRNKMVLSVLEKECNKLEQERNRLKAENERLREALNKIVIYRIDDHDQEWEQDDDLDYVQNIAQQALKEVMR